MKNQKIFAGFVFSVLAIFVFSAGLQENIYAQDEVQIIKKYDQKADVKDYQQITDFLYKGENIFGKLHPKAPPETGQFGKLAGVWEAENSALFQGKWYCCWRAVWAFKYTLDGFGVQDYYVQLERDFPPTVQKRGVDSALTQLRVFIPKDKNWKVSWISNATAYGSFTAVEKDGEIIMTPPKVEGQPLSRIVFYEIKKDSFLWRKDFSNDNGKTWEKRFLIKAKRLL